MQTQRQIVFEITQKRIMWKLVSHELDDVRAIMNKVKCPRKLDISVFYQLTGRLPQEGLEFKLSSYLTI